MSNNNILDLSIKLNNLKIVPKKNKQKRIDINVLVISMSKMKIGKKTKQKRLFYPSYDLFSIINKKLFMDEIFGPILFRYFQKYDRIKIKLENNDDNDGYIAEIEE